MDLHRSNLQDSPAYLLQALTAREVEILELAGTGLSVKGLARELGITPMTASWHIKNSYQKLNVGSREEALRKAREMGLIRPQLVCRICACKLGQLVS